MRRHSRRVDGCVAVLTLLGLCAPLVAACSMIPGENNTRPATENKSLDAEFLDSIRSIDLQPRFPAEPQQEKVATGNRVRPMIYTGDDQPALAPDQAPLAPYQPRVTPVEARLSANGDG